MFHFLLVPQVIQLAADCDMVSVVVRLCRVRGQWAMDRPGHRHGCVVGRQVTQLALHGTTSRKFESSNWSLDNLDPAILLSGSHVPVQVP